MNAQPPIDPEQLPALLAGCRRMERASQRQLYTRFYSYALSICLRYAHHREAAMEVVNDGFMKLFRDIGRFDPGRYELQSSFQGWLKSIMIHTAIDYYRAQVKQQQQLALEEAAYARADAAPTPLDNLAYEDLTALIQQLTPAYRTVFNLYVLDGFTHEEIARQLGISVGASKSNLSKARGHLREFLQRTNHYAHAESIG
ncbi:RNA polymerase sigma factor [Hymenobacter sp. DG25B]|uniref:RNA polymerase sigma factor n=1 Tax=Hymenobacter sp. DG25B TaxID=1385664 RepID=UPI000AEDA05F|nr:RNA polymerase sigma factor [Hymenobacter sp. DG25B]